MRILVTRPESQAQELLAAIEEGGFEPLALPLLAIDAINSSADQAAIQAIKRCVLDLDQYQHLIFASTNAVHCAFYWINRYWPQLPVDLNWYAIGDATARALAEYAVEADAAGGSMNSETLLQQTKLQQLDHQRVVIFRGVGGRVYLAEQLRSRGATVDYCEVYRRRAVSYPAGKLRQLVAGGEQTVLTVTSVETLENLLQMAKQDAIALELCALPLLVPGQRVAQHAREAGFTQLIVAENAGVKAFMAALLNYKNQ
jgi:uroporphyrinogen-III synthase